MLEVERLSVSYGTVHALQEVDLRIAGEGVYMGSSGRTALASPLCWTPCPGDAGRPPAPCAIAAKTSRGKSVAWRRRRGMSRSFQRTNIFQDLTVREQLSLVAWRLGDDRVGDVIETMDLGDYLDKRQGGSPMACSAGSTWRWR